MIGKIDQIIERSLRKLAEDNHVRSWCAKERDWVNYFAHRYLAEECFRRGPLREPGQICIEVAVPQPPGYVKLSVSRDLVIWPKCGDTCFDGDWKPRKHPLAILEWKVHRPGHRNRKVDNERIWLRAYCKWQPSVLAYAIEQRHRRYWLWGALYGLALMFWSFAAAGAGHGTYVVLGLSSSPLGWLGFSAAFFCLPVLWAVVGLFLGRVNSKPYKLVFLVVAAVHYVSIVPLLSGEMFGDWDYFHRVLSVAPVGVLGGLVTYLAGQVAMWGAFFRAERLS